MLHTLGSRFRQLTDEMAAHETIILQCRVRCRGVSVMALVAAAGITTYLTTHRITSPPSRTSVNSGTVWSLPLIPRVKRLHPFSAAEWTLTVATDIKLGGKVRWIYCPI